MKSRATHASENVEFLADLNCALGRVVQAVTPVEAYGAADDAAQIGHKCLDLGPVAARAYTYWAAVADVYELGEITGIPEEGFLVVAKDLAREWLSTPADALGGFVATAAFDPVEMVTRAGFTVRVPNPFLEQPWRGHWANLVWSIEHVDVTHSPYAATQRVLQDLRTEPVLWERGHGARLAALLSEWDQHPHERDRIDGLLRAQLSSMSDVQVPPLDPPIFL